MFYIPRILATQLQKAAENFPAVLLTGSRQCGKTTLLRRTFGHADYALLEDPDVIARVRSDPRGYLASLKTPVILDEIQNTPELFSYIRTSIDMDSRLNGQWLLTGSQEAPVMKGVSESMAGRVAILELFPLSTLESDKVNALHGGYPDVVLNPDNAELWFRSYIQTYLERDVRAVTAIRDLSIFRRFLALLASRHGCMLNKTDLAAPLGVSVPTISSWLNVLAITGQIILVPPFFENFGKRLVKSPKLYFTDAGLLCHLLGIDGLAELNKAPFQGLIFEGFLASEIIKCQVNSGRRKELYYFRDQQGLEVDFVIPQGADHLLLVEAKATKTPTPSMAAPMRRFADAVKGYSVDSMLVYSGAGDLPAGSTLAPGITAGPLSALLSKLGGEPARLKPARRCSPAGS